MIRTFQVILIFKQNIILWKVYILHVMSMEWQTPCCYPVKIFVMEESVCSTHQVAGSFKLLFEVTMKNTDILNIKPVSLLFLLLLFKLGFVEYFKKNVYILKKKKGPRSPSGVGFCFLIWMANLPSHWTPELDSIVAALALKVVGGTFFFLLKTC